MPASSIFLLDADTASAEAISTTLSSVGYTVTVTVDPADAIAKATDHQLVIVDVVTGPMSAVELCQALRATPAMSEVPIVCVSQTDDVDERIAFLEAGADDVMAKPFDGRELEARVEALLLRFQRSGGQGPIYSADGLTMARARRTIAVFSPKGGVGTTTIATNIAVSAALRRPDKVVLVDLALQFGGVSSHLNLETRGTLADLVRDEIAMREPEIMRPYAIRHDSGLHVLAAPGTPEGADLVTPEHVAKILKNLLEAYDSVVIDAGAVLDERSMTALEAAEAVMLPVYPEIAALRAVHNLIDYFNDVGSITQKSTFILNNVFAKDILKPRDVETALGSKVGRGAAVRRVPVPQGRQRGDPDGHRGTEVGGRRSAQQAEPERLRRGWLQRAGRRQRAPLGPLRASPPGLTGSRAPRGWRPPGAPLDLPRESTVGPTRQSGRGGCPRHGPNVRTGPDLGLWQARTIGRSTAASRRARLRQVPQWSSAAREEVLIGGPQLGDLGLDRRGLGAAGLQVREPLLGRAPLGEDGPAGEDLRGCRGGTPRPGEDREVAAVVEAEIATANRTFVPSGRCMTLRRRCGLADRLPFAPEGRAGLVVGGFW